MEVTWGAVAGVWVIDGIGILAGLSPRENRFDQERVRSIDAPVEGFLLRSGPGWSSGPANAPTVDGNSRSAASFSSLATMPNSAACLIALVVSLPALARAMTLALDACACSRNDENRCC